jgi:hypothetical protein
MLKKTIALIIALSLFFSVKAGFTKGNSNDFTSFGNIIPINLSGK